MLKQFVNHLRRPHPMETSLFHALILGGIVFFILFVLKPFGFGNLDVIQRGLKSLAFGGITTSAVIFNQRLARLLIPSIMDENKWTLFHEYIYSIYDLVMIAFWNTLFLSLFAITSYPFLLLFMNIGTNTVIIGIIPTIIQISLKHNEALKQQLIKANELNDELEKYSSASEQKTIILRSENDKPEIQLKTEELIYLKSDGNYVDAYYENTQGHETKQLLRNRIKNVLKSLPEDAFFQCHKSYVINIDRITKVHGNARDFKLSMRGTDSKIPVSRSKTTNLLELLNRS